MTFTDKLKNQPGRPKSSYVIEVYFQINIQT